MPGAMGAHASEAMRATRQMTNEIVRSSGLGAAALGALLTIAGCHGRRPAPQNADPRAVAEAASREGNWRLAAERWNEVYLVEGTQSATPCVETARALLRLGDATGALQWCEVGLEQHPQHPDLYELHGDALVALGFRRAAEDCYKQTLALDPERVSTLVSLARVRIDLGLESEAVPLLKEAVTRTGGNAEIYALLAHAQNASGDPCGAFDSYKKTFVLREGSLEEYLAASALCLEMSVCRADPKANETCIGWLEHALERDPQSTQANFQLGVLHEDLGHAEKAIERYRRAVETDPAYLPALTNLAVLYASRGDRANTLEMVERALKLEEDGTRRKALQKLLEPANDKQVAREQPVEQR